MSNGDAVLNDASALPDALLICTVGGTRYLRVPGSSYLFHREGEDGEDSELDARSLGGLSRIYMRRDDQFSDVAFLAKEFDGSPEIAAAVDLVSDVGERLFWREVANELQLQHERTILRDRARPALLAAGFSADEVEMTLVTVADDYC